MSDTRGYSAALVELVAQRDQKHLTTQLATYCIRKGITAADVAAAVGVSRTTIYEWFKGVVEPKPVMADAIMRYLAKRNISG